MIEYMEEVKYLVVQDARIMVLRKRRAVVHAAYIKWRMKPFHLRRYPSNWSPIKALIDKDRIGAKGGRSAI